VASITRPSWFERGARRAASAAIVVLASACGGPAAEVPPPAAVPASTAPVEASATPTAAAAPSSSASVGPAAAPSAAPTADRPPAVAAAATAEPAASAPTPCDTVLGVARHGQAKLAAVTVLTPHPDATRAEIIEATTAAVDALKVADPALGKLAKGWAKALHAEAAAVKAFAVAYEAG